MKLKYNKQLDFVKRWIAPTGRQNYLKLDLNENYSILDRKLIKLLTKIDNFTVSCYPEYDHLIDLLSNYTSTNPKNITLTNGADQAIDLLIRLFFNKNNRIVIPSPVFSIYDHDFSILGSKIQHIPYILSKNSFNFPIDEVLKKIVKSDGIILCNPNNPLGSVIKEEYLKKIIKITYNLNIPCIVDEAYFEFYGKSIVNLIKKFPNLIVIRTFSKIFALAGLRLGYIVAEKNITQQLLKIRGPWDVNHFAVKSGEIFLENKDIFINQISNTRRLRNDLINFCKSLGLEVYKSETNFITVKLFDHIKAVEIFRSNGILVNDLTGYPFDNHLLDDCIRITVPNDDGLQKLKLVLLKFKK